MQITGNNSVELGRKMHKLLIIVPLLSMINWKTINLWERFNLASHRLILLEGTKGKKKMNIIELLKKSSFLNSVKSK